MNKRGEDISEVARLASFPTLNPSPIIEIDFEGKIEYANPAAKAKFSGIETLGLSHPFFANWKNMIKAFKEKKENSFLGEVRVGEHWYLQQSYLVPESQRIRIYSINITERKKAEEALRESESMLKNIIDGSPSFIFLKDKDGRFITINKRLEESLGMKREELRGKTDYDIFPKEVADYYRENDRQVLETKQPAQNEEIFDSPDGKKYTLLANKFPLFNTSGEVIATCGISTDITQRKKAEDALTESEERWSTTLSSIGDAVIATDVLGNITFINSVAEVLTGYSLAEAAQKPLMEIFHIVNEETRREVENPVTKVLKNGAVVGLANHSVLISKDGSEIPIDDSGSPIRDRDGQVTGVVLVFHNITERKKSEEQIRQSQKTFYELVERSPFGIYIVDSQFRIAHMNIRSQNDAFRNVRPIIGRPFNEAMHTLWSDEVAEEIISHFRHTLETGEPYYSPQFTNPRNDVGVVESYEWELQRIMLPDGYGVICYYFDSSKLRETERALTEAQAELKNHAADLERLVEERTKQLKDSERLAAIGATAGMVGHDIRNPLQAITSDIYLVKSDLSVVPESEEKQTMKESLDGIEKNVEYINKIVQDLQDYARPLQPAVKEIDLQSLCDDILLKSAVPKNIHASCSIKKDTKLVISDSDLLKRVLNNLIINAVQAMPDGGKLTILGYKDKQTADVIIDVTDTGSGIPESAKPNLFTPMFTTKSKGQGFGLAVVKRITESMGGTISFESEVDKGTTFTVRLPPPRDKR